ncbi:MAG: hypothetical protein JWL73_3467 [Actinomycetia bacterium]|nr:hypothetical protein [Actinomycetes bacterium]
MHDVRRLTILGVLLVAIAAYVVATTGSHVTRVIMIGAVVLYAVGVFQIRQQVRNRNHHRL